MKFQEDRCGKCGVDLTEAEPTRLRELQKAEEMIIIAPCPKCGDDLIANVEDLSVGTLSRLLEEADPVHLAEAEATATEAGPLAEAEAVATETGHTEEGAPPTEAGPTEEGASPTEPDPTVCPSCGGAKSPSANVCRNCYEAGRSETE